MMRLRTGLPTLCWTASALAAPLTCAQDMPILERCLAKLDAQVDIGYDRIVARCPELPASLESSAWSAWLPPQWKQPGNDLSAGGLRELRDLGAAESTRTASRPIADVATLRLILVRLGETQMRPTGAWARLKAWLRSRLQSGQSASGDDSLREWLTRLGASQAVLELIAYLALSGTVVLAGAIVLTEARVAGLLRTPRLSLRKYVLVRNRRGGSTADSADRNLDAAPLTDQPRLLMQLISAKLTLAGLLPEAGSLTLRECLRAAAGLLAEDRARLADLASVAERVRYSGHPVSPQSLQSALARGRELLSRLETAHAC